MYFYVCICEDVDTYVAPGALWTAVAMVALGNVAQSNHVQMM